MDFFSSAECCYSSFDGFGVQPPPTPPPPPQQSHLWTDPGDHRQTFTSTQAHRCLPLRQSSQASQEDPFDGRWTPTAKAGVGQPGHTQTPRQWCESFDTANVHEADFHQMDSLQRQMDRMQIDHQIALSQAETARARSAAAAARHETEAARLTKQAQDHKDEIDVLKRLIAAQEMSIELLHDLNQWSRLSLRLLKPKLEEISRVLAQRNTPQNLPEVPEVEFEHDVEDEKTCAEYDDEDECEFEYEYEYDDENRYGYDDENRYGYEDVCQYEYEGDVEDEDDEVKVEAEVDDWISLHSADGEAEEQG